MPAYTFDPRGFHGHDDRSAPPPSTYPSKQQQYYRPPTLVRLIGEHKWDETPAADGTSAVTVTETSTASRYERVKAAISSALPLTVKPWLQVLAFLALLSLALSLLLALAIDRFLYVSDGGLSIGGFVYCVDSDCTNVLDHLDGSDFLVREKLLAARAMIITGFLLACGGVLAALCWLTRPTQFLHSAIIATQALVMACCFVCFWLWLSMKPIGSDMLASFWLVIGAFITTLLSSGLWIYFEITRRRLFVPLSTADSGSVSVAVSGRKPVVLRDYAMEWSVNGRSVSHVYTLPELTEFERHQLESTECNDTGDHGDISGTGSGGELTQRHVGVEAVRIPASPAVSKDDAGLPAVAGKPTHLRIDTGGSASTGLVDELLKRVKKYQRLTSTDCQTPVSTVNVHPQLHQFPTVVEWNAANSQTTAHCTSDGAYVASIGHQLSETSVEMVEDDVCFDSRAEDGADSDSVRYNGRYDVHRNTLGEIRADASDYYGHQQVSLKDLVETVTVN